MSKLFDREIPFDTVEDTIVGADDKGCGKHPYTELLRQFRLHLSVDLSWYEASADMLSDLRVGERSGQHLMTKMTIVRGHEDEHG